MLLDSVILIDYLNEVSAAREFVEETPASISVVTFAEVLTGVDAATHEATVDFLKTFPIHHIDTTIAERAAQLRRSETWKLPDAFQAAVALHHGLKLATRNTKDFDPAWYDFVHVPYSI